MSGGRRTIHSPELDYLDGRADEWSARINLAGMIAKGIIYLTPVPFPGRFLPETKG